MSNPLQEQLLGHLLGALEESEETQLAARLQSDPEARGELARVRSRLEILELGRYDFTPPPGLAARTCERVAAQAGSTSVPRRRPMYPVAAGPSTPGRFRWTDVAMAAGIFLIAALLTPPAIQSSRFNANMYGCTDNLRAVGLGLQQYSELHGGYFPGIPAQGKLAVAGVYAPILVSGGLVESRRFVCPASSLAEAKGFRVPTLDALNAASQDRLEKMVAWLGGSYGYDLGYISGGTYHGPKNRGRSGFALAADLPGSDPSNGRQSPNHGGLGQNVLDESGGVRFVTSPQPNPQADNIFVNDWGLVAPGLHEMDSVIGPSFVRPIGTLPGQ